MSKPRLLFVSTRFLFPVDSGGKIRTTQILRGMKESGEYEIVLVSPATLQERENFKTELESVSDVFLGWDAPSRGSLFNLTRMRYLLSDIPIPVRTDFDAAGATLIAEEMDKCDVVVFDFLHAAVLTPELISKPSVLFTHNVEAEIFQRHIEAANNPLFRWIWKNQYQKMFRYEGEQVDRFDVVVAVSERDGEKFKSDYGLADAFCIPTGVDLDYFAYQPPSRANDIVFCGSMDWMANQDAIDYFLDDIWPLISKARPDCRFTVVGRNPPKRLLDKAAVYGEAVKFTGFVDDVRDYIAGARANVIPIRVGGGTRLKVYEAMSIGTPIVSTTIGVEGLPVQDGTHYACADDAALFAQRTIDLLDDEARATSISEHAREAVEAEFSYRNAARVFTQACQLSQEKHANA